MPFVTEELWQRLPRRPNDTTQSIMLSRFPVYVRPSKFSGGHAYSVVRIQDASLVDKAAETDFALVFAATRAIRSLAVQYNLQKNVDGM
jgi:valyl-tRNA synthetase